MSGSEQLEYRRSGLEDGAIHRLAGLAPLTEEEVGQLRLAARAATWVKPYREIAREGEKAPAPSLLLEGWACRTRYFADGRRQILGMLLPGERFGAGASEPSRSVTGIVALTSVAICPAPRAGDADTGLGKAYALSDALAEHYLFRQIARLGRMSALDRAIDWMLEVHERLSLAGLASDAAFPMQITQEVIADVLGLTSVHVNRTLQLMRRDGSIDLSNAMVRLLDRPRLAASVEFREALSLLGSR